MIKITVEELDIVVQASVEQALTEFKKIVPQLKKTIKQVENNLNDVNTKGMTNKIQQAVQQVKQKINEVKNTGIDKQLQTQFNKAGASVEKYQGQLEQTKEKLRQVYAEMDNIQANTWKAYTPEGVELGNKAIEPSVNNDLAGNKQYQNLSKEAIKLEQQITSINSKLNETKQQYSQIAGQIQQTSAKQSIWSNLINKIKNSFNTLRSSTNSVKKSFGQLPSITAKINTKITQMGKGLKQGLGHILKYAGALFSLRTIYSALSSAANAWLSSQNSGAQQLSANIEYMKYAMGSALAPVIQFVTNLVYQLMKAIQSVAYALTGVNIFANASAKAYSNMASSAKEANKQTKQLSGVHSEINNVSSSDSGSSSGSGGNIAPSFDLSKLENTSNSIVEAIKKGDWHQVGVEIGNKLNEAMNKIPWDKIQEGARKIGTGISESLNGFISTIDWTKVGNTFAQGLNIIIYTGQSFVNNFDFSNFGKSIGTSLSAFIGNIDWNAWSNTISSATKGLFNTISGFFETFDWSVIIDGLINFITGYDWNGVSDAIFRALGSACASLVNLGMVIGEKINEALDKAKNYFQEKIEECGGNVVAGIFKGILDAIAGIGQWINDHIFKPFIEGFKNVFGIHSPSTVMEEQGNFIMQGLLNGITSLVSKVKEIWENIKNNVNEVFNNIKTSIVNIWNNVKNTTTNVWNTIKTKVKEGAQGAWNAITSIFGNITGWFRDKFTQAWQAVKNIFSTGGKIFDGIKEGILSGLKTIVNAIINGINKVIKIPFDGINSALRTIKNVDIMGLKPFNWIGTISVPQIPQLAKGAVLKVPTVAEMAEYPGARTNPEIVAPQNIMEETFDRVLSRYQNEDNTPIYLTVNVGNAKLGQILLDDLRNMKRRSGKDIEALVGG